MFVTMIPRLPHNSFLSNGDESAQEESENCIVPDEFVYTGLWSLEDVKDIDELADAIFDLQEAWLVVKSEEKRTILN